MCIARWFRSILILSLFFGFATCALPGRTAAQVVVSVNFGPPEIPVYEQPLCPGDGYIWVPGYWAWYADDDDYYWVPGTWVLPPEVGFLWTPGYWGWNGAAFVFYEGYWGPVVGFYGGINYGFGYYGHGYEGGRWDHDHFYYNRTVNNINVTEIHNVYNTTIVNNNTTRVSYNGGNGGINVRPTAQEQAAAQGRHVAPVAQQVQHVQAARTDQALRASQNHGKPPIAATPKPAAFSEHGVVAAKEGGKYNPPPRAAGSHGSPSGTAAQPNAAPPSARPSNPGTVIHPSEAPPHDRPAAPNTGNPNLDRKYQQQQDKLRAKQEQEHQKLQQQQEQEHQKMQKQQADEARKQQMEQHHQQQTQQMEQRHAQEQQKLQQRQQPPPPQHPNERESKPPHP